MHPKIHEKFMSLASDEGKHANMLRKITGEICKPTNTLANMVVCLSYVIGKKLTLKIMANAETKALDTYKPFAAQYPELEEMRLDEGKHGETLRSIVKELYG